MDSQTLLTALITIGVGSISGGITNAVAVWMLFNPHEEWRFGPFRLVGAIPKNKARLAKSIGRVVGQKLLTPEDLATRLNSPVVREAFDEAVGGTVRRLLSEEHPALAERFSAETRTGVDTVIHETSGRLAGRLADWAATPAFAELVGTGLERLRGELGSRPVGDLLTAENREALAERLDRWAEALVQADETERALRGWVVNLLTRLEDDDRPLVDRLPPGILAPIEQTIHEALPALIDKLGQLLADPEAKGSVKQALRDAFDASARRMLIHERLLARLVVSDKAIERLVDGFEAEGFERFAEAVNAPEIRARVASAIQAGLESLLREPLGARLRRLPLERRAALAETLGDWLVNAAREPATRQALRSGLERTLDKAGAWTWEEVLALLPAGQAAKVLAGLASSERGRALVAQGLASAATALLSRPVGRPADWIGEETVDRLAGGVSQAAWGWVGTHLPAVIDKLSVPEMVEQKVLGFSTRRMEEIVRTVTQRELDLIVRLGFVLGAIVGGVAFGVNQLVRG
jgi:uncharacterized membrane-anchored protein YjiN (DUF445 family)